MPCVEWEDMDSGHARRAGSVSPLRHRKVDDRYRSDFDNTSGPHVMCAGSVSPYRHRKVDDRYRPDFEKSISPHVMRASSVSPLRHRKMDDRYRSDFDNSSGPQMMHGGSVSPLRQRKVDNRYRPVFSNTSGPQRGRGFVGGRAPGRFRDFSPPYGRGRRGGRRPSGRDFDMHGFDHAPFRNDGMVRNSANVAPRAGDWMCPDPSCGNLNFARRDYCNKCNRPHFGPGDSPRTNYLGPPRFSSPPLNRSPVKGGLNGYSSPPRDWSRDDPREYRAGPSHIRHGGRFPDHQFRRERPDYPEEDYRGRESFDRPAPLDWGHRGRGSGGGFFNGRRAYDARNERRPLSPPPPLSHDRWARDARERSRSPMVGGPAKSHRRDSFVDRGRGPRWGIGRDRFDDHPY